MIHWLLQFIKFSRPHTVIGTTLSVGGLYLVALAGGHGYSYHPVILFLTLLSCLGANIYIVGLNQLTDIEIDRINKPELPLASGEFSRRTGQVIILVSLAISVTLSVILGEFLFITVMLSLLIGTAYSVPPFRLKRFHFWAAASIFSVRGGIVNIFLFLHFNLLFNNSRTLPSQIWALTFFMFGLSLIIAWFKDIPDMEGDNQFRIGTLSLRLGAGNVFILGRILLSFFYFVLILAAVFGLRNINTQFFIIAHLLLLGLMWVVSFFVNPLKHSQIHRYYLFVWVLFFSEYIVFAVACLTA